MVEGTRGRASTVIDRWHESLAGQGWRRANDVGLVTQTLALAAQQVLCTAPLLVAASAVARRNGGRGIGVSLTHYLGLTGESATEVAALFRGSGRVSKSELALGLVLAIVFSTGAAATQQRSYESIWSQPRVGLRATPRQALWVFGLLVYLAITMRVGRLGHDLSAVHGWAHLLRVIPLTFFSFLFYWWTQHLLLCGRVSWRDLARGAAFMGFGTAVVVVLSAAVLPGQITEQVADYGQVGVGFVLAIWLVVLTAVVLWGALLGAVIVERRDFASGARSASPPATTPPATSPPATSYPATPPTSYPAN